MKIQAARTAARTTIVPILAPAIAPTFGLDAPPTVSTGVDDGDDVIDVGAVLVDDVEFPMVVIHEVSLPVWT
jgi:hypothetical protein